MYINIPDHLYHDFRGFIRTYATINEANYDH